MSDNLLSDFEISHNLLGYVADSFLGEAPAQSGRLRTLNHRGAIAKGRVGLRNRLRRR